jgi:hypothetical protein
MVSPVSRHEQRTLAIELIRRGLRTTIVHLITGIPHAELRDLYRDIHGRSPSSGLLPSTASLFPNRRSHTYVSLFASLYRQIGGKKILKGIDARILIEAHDLFLALLRPIRNGHNDDLIDFTDMWVIARDIRSKVARIEFCEHCRVDYLLAEGSRLPPTCPFCALRKERRRMRNRKA